MRPGVAERLGIGPDACGARDRAPVYVRMTRWGQTGPLAQYAGHDVTYVALTGAPRPWAERRPPDFPSNLLAGYAGGSMYLVTRILAALLERSRSGEGDVVDAAIVDGTVHLNTLTSSFMAAGVLEERRASNMLDGGRPFYNVYETSDGEHVAVGALEPQFFAELVRLLDLPALADRQHDVSSYPEMREAFASRFRAHPQAHWTAIFERHGRLRRSSTAPERGTSARALRLEFQRLIVSGAVS